MYTCHVKDMVEACVNQIKDNLQSGYRIVNHAEHIVIAKSGLSFKHLGHLISFRNFYKIAHCNKNWLRFQSWPPVDVAVKQKGLVFLKTTYNC